MYYVLLFDLAVGMTDCETPAARDSRETETVWPQATHAHLTDVRFSVRGQESLASHEVPDCSHVLPMLY